MRDYVKRVHKGLIKASGYVDPEDVEPWEWLYWDYIQKSNKDFGMRRLDKQLNAYKEEESKRSRGRIRLPDGQPMEEDEESEELQDEDTALVQLDSGETVRIPTAYLQPREPESEEEVENMAVDSEPTTRSTEREVSRNVASGSSGQNDPTLSGATAGRIRDGQIWLLKSLGQPKLRASLRARQRILHLENEWSSANRRGDGELKFQVYKDMDKRYPFLDCPGFPH